LFFDRFREALSRLPDGLVRTGPPATAEALAAAESALGPLPPILRSFLQSFDGVDLFHEAVLIAGVGPHAPRSLTALNPVPGGELVFAEAAGTDRFALRGDGAVLRLRAGDEESDPERWLAGSGFERWLEAVVAHERVLYGPDGEFSPDAFEPDGAEVLPLAALRQAERALKLDPDSAELHHERAVALRRLGRQADSRQAFARAAALDPDNPWTWFDLGRAALADGVTAGEQALEAFQRAARLVQGQQSARFWVWAARAAQLLAAPERQESCRREALALVPDLATALQRARDAAATEDDPDALAEAEALLAALEGPIMSGRKRLPVLEGGGPPRSSGAPATSSPSSSSTPASPPESSRGGKTVSRKRTARK
jgi:tetratricopeptide (TPR) repeat protein